VLLPNTEVTNYFVWQGKQGASEAEAIAVALRGCDWVVSHPLGDDMGPLATSRLRRTAKRLMTLPGIGFHGFHPDQMYLHSGSDTVESPTGGYHSRLAVAGFLAGLSPAEVAGLYYKLAFVRLGYLRTYEEDFLLLAENFAAHGLEAGAMLAKLRASGVFMYSCNHPKRGALLELARVACAKMELAPVAVEEAGVQDFLAVHPVHPVFADVAAALGVAPEGMFRGGIVAGRDPLVMSPEEYVARCHDIYAELDRALLRKADGVAAAMAALGLAEAAPPPPRRHWQRGMALMTWHGSLLRQTADGGALHLPLDVPDAQVALLRVDLQGGTLPDRLPALGGVEVRPGARAQTLALARGKQFLSAARGSASVFFRREAVGDWESFLPVTDAQLDVLQQLLAGAWAAESGATGQTARLLEGPAVILGSHRVDLAASWPREVAAAADRADSGGPARLAVRLNGGTAVLRQTLKPSRAPAPVARKIALGERLVVAGAPVLLPLPLTLNNAERIWLHTACGQDDGLPWQDEKPEVAVYRQGDQRMTGAPPAPGATLDEAVVLDGVVAQVGADDAAFGWAAPVLRLLAMAPYLAPDTRVIAPGEAAAGQALAAAWQGLGLPPFEVVVAPPAAIYTARDTVRLDPAQPSQWPGEILRGVRTTLLQGAKPGRGRIFVRGRAAAAIANWPAFETALGELGFGVIEAAAAPPASMLAELRGAGWLMGVGEDLLHAAFCPAGTKVVELSGDAAFDTAAWRLSCRLGLTHAVLPCACVVGGFTVDAGRLADLVRMVSFRL
jgi:hypothetical protein